MYLCVLNIVYQVYLQLVISIINIVQVHKVRLDVRSVDV